MSNADILNHYAGIAFQKGADAYVCVEDHDDIEFWNDLFKSVKHDKVYYFDPYHSGKNYLLKNFAAITTSKFIICVDSDISLFLVESGNNKHFITRPPFFYCTYTHSRENHLLNVNALKHLIQNKTNHIFNELKDILESLSEIIYPAVLLHILFEKSPDFKAYLKDVDKGNCLSWDNLCPILNLEEDLANVENGDDLKSLYEFTNIQKRVKTFIDDINAATFEAYQEDLETLSTAINEHFKVEESLFLIQGHIAEEVFLRPLLGKIIDILIEKRKQEVVNDARIKDKQPRFNQLDKQKIDLKNDLKTNYRYCLSALDSCNYIGKIIRDMKNDLSIPLSV
jgi:hypothetical protein